MGKEQDEAKKWAEENIRIDKTTLPEYGSDQMYVNYPKRFGVVTYGLESTEGLVQEAEEVRIAEGTEPDIDVEEEEVDDSERGAEDYEFELSVADIDGGRADSSITVYDSISESVRSIDMTEAQQAAAYEQLNAQSKEVYGQDCRQLLDEADKYMERQYSEKEQAADDISI